MSRSDQALPGAVAAWRKRTRADRLGSLERTPDELRTLIGSRSEIELAGRSPAEGWSACPRAASGRRGADRDGPT